jgi:hypothetical protein
MIDRTLPDALAKPAHVTITWTTPAEIASAQAIASPGRIHGPVLVRQSRAVGLPPRVPDIFGLAVQVPTQDGRHVDLLLASTGVGRLTRFTLAPPGRTGDA